MSHSRIYGDLTKGAPHKAIIGVQITHRGAQSSKDLSGEFSTYINHCPLQVMFKPT